MTNEEKRPVKGEIEASMIDGKFCMMSECSASYAVVFALTVLQTAENFVRNKTGKSVAEIALHYIVDRENVRPDEESK